MKVKVRPIVRTPKRVHVTLIRPPKPRIKPVGIYDAETAQDFALSEDMIFDTSAEDAEQSYVELFDEVEDMFDDAISDADEDAARFHIDEASDDGNDFVDELDEYENTVILDKEAEESEDEATVILEDETDELDDEATVILEDETDESDDEATVILEDETDESDDEATVILQDETDIPDFELANADIFDTDEGNAPDSDNDSDTGVFCRYFDRDNQGEMVEVDQADASGREFVYIDENSGKLSRICGIIKNEPASDDDSIF
ncbi:MAG: hypothetical protein J6L81_05420 [Clostridia bacterium]|nr:hypothetical protein [Clostridia bacterium]